MESFAGRSGETRDHSPRRRPQDGSATLRYLVVVALIAAVFVLAFAVFGDKVYEQFQELARKVAEAT